jgi:hypothetical protein
MQSGAIGLGVSDFRLPRSEDGEKFSLSRFSQSLFRIPGKVGALQKLFGGFIIPVSNPSRRNAARNFRGEGNEIQMAAPS